MYDNRSNSPPSPLGLVTFNGASHQQPAGIPVSLCLLVLPLTLWWRWGFDPGDKPNEPLREHCNATSFTPQSNFKRSRKGLRSKTSFWIYFSQQKKKGLMKECALKQIVHAWLDIRPNKVWNRNSFLTQLRILLDEGRPLCCALKPCLILKRRVNVFLSLN